MSIGPASQPINIYYHVSEKKLPDTLYPRVPDNNYTYHGYEDYLTKRVCFGPSVDKCLVGLAANLKDKTFFVYIFEDINNIAYHPTQKEVFDVDITNEVWIKEPAKIKYIGKIKVIKDNGEDYPVVFPDGSQEAVLCGWIWKWIEQKVKLTCSDILSHFNIDIFKRYS